MICIKLRYRQNINMLFGSMLFYIVIVMVVSLSFL